MAVPVARFQSFELQIITMVYNDKEAQVSSERGIKIWHAKNNPG